MRHTIEQIKVRKHRIAGHPFYHWLRSAPSPLERRFDFAPILVNFILAFSDMNKWFMRYPKPASEYEQAINRHTREDETHSRLFIEDWRKLGLDRRLGWSAGDTLAWYHAAPETDRFRQHGMAILEMLTTHDDPLVRFALMESIEAWGHIMFAATAQAASKLTSLSGDEYRYFGPYHLKRELGHVLAGGPLFESASLDEGRRAHALALVHRFFDIAEDESDRLLHHARQAIDGVELPPLTQSPQTVRQPRAPAPTPSARRPEGCAAPGQARARQLLEERKRRAARHPLFAWMRADGGEDPVAKLRQIALFWAPDCLGYRDLNTHALSYSNPRDPSERAINRWATQLGSHHQLFLRDWSALSMDQRLGFSASDTLEFYCRSRHSEVQRQSMSSFVKLAFLHPDPVSRFWLLEALEASGEAFFASTRRLAARAEAEHGLRLDYLGDRHEISHPALEPDPEADAFVFAGEPLDASQEDVAVTMIHTVFDCLEQQFSASLEQATSGAFLLTPGHHPVHAA